MNPYKQLSIFGNEYVTKYMGKTLPDNPPHIFAIGERAYRLMLKSRKNQSILIRYYYNIFEVNFLIFPFISGESGAGKYVQIKEF